MDTVYLYLYLVLSVMTPICLFIQLNKWQEDKDSARELVWLIIITLATAFTWFELIVTPWLYD